ncbi:MAG: citrate transporter [Lachnospiraceae bacterium]|nr:citrate transporter [Lachnospiraceae bacterium]
MKKLIHFIRQEIVLSVAVFLAAISMFWVPPSKEYVSYMNWHVLSLLFCLMLVMEGLKQLGVFSEIAGILMRKAKSFLQLVLILVFLCFFSAMFITNDVALITFVPFAIEVLKMAGKENKMIAVIVLQTMAANLGSMLTPIGNPQNLYLYDHAGYSLSGFLAVMVLPCAISFLLLFFSSSWIAKNEKMDNISFPPIRYWTRKRKVLTGMYIVLFMVSIFVVAEVITFGPALFITVAAVVLADRKILKGADYCLLLTFCGFFIFVGNMGNIESIALLLEKWMQGREFFVAVLASQVISNVPAALLLSGFTQDYKALLLGVNIGGLGTLIASMASLISYKLYAKAYPKQKGRYMGYFTGMNLLYLAIFCVLYLFL